MRATEKEREEGATFETRFERRVACRETRSLLVSKRRRDEVAGKRGSSRL